jgi:four helix bundle protein
MRGFTDLEARKKADDLRKDISELLKSFPCDEKYRLTDQIIRSSRSVGNNIAQGHGRFYLLTQESFL